MADPTEALEDRMIRQTLTMGLMADLVAMVIFIIDPSTQLRTALLVGSPSLGLALALGVHRAGYPQVAGWMGATLVTIGATAVFSLYWGIDEHQGIFLGTAIVCAGLIMGPRASLAATAVTVGYAFYDYVVGPMNWSVVDYEPSRWERFFDIAIALVVIGLLSSIGMERVHRLLREQSREQAFRSALLQESPTPTLVVDALNTIVDVNAAAANLCGDRAAVLVGTRLSHWIHDEVDGEGLLRAAGGPVPVRIRVAQVDAVGRERKVVALVDLRPERETLRKQQEAVTAAQEASHAKSAFLASMSHELRTPLNAIIGYAELLDEEGVDHRQRSDLGRILTAGRHLLALVDDVLDMSKVEAGKAEIHWEVFDLSETLRECVSAVEGEALRARLRIELRCPEKLSVRADRLRVRQVLLNMLSNAVRFAETAIIMEMTSEGDTARIVCADDGSGVPDDLAPRLFQPFVRGDTPRSRTGLGLALSRELANRMGGDLRLVNQGPLDGAVFVFELRRRHAPETGTFSVTPPI